MSKKKTAINKKLKSELYFLQLRLDAELNQENIEFTKEENNPEITMLKSLIEMLQKQLRGKK